MAAGRRFPVPGRLSSSIGQRFMSMMATVTGGANDTTKLLTQKIWQNTAPFSSCRSITTTTNVKMSHIMGTVRRRRSSLTRTIVTARYLTRDHYNSIREVPNFAFAFDIDGVLYRSGKPIPGAIGALKMLYNHKIPFILLTNGGGKHEIERTKELSQKFGVDLSVKNFVQSHTPFQEMAMGTDTYAPLKDKNILVTGGDQVKCREIAHEYGFKNVVTPADILMDQPAVWPFNQLLYDHYMAIGRPLPRQVDLKFPSKSLKIDAIFVYNDPRDWALDIQIITDLLASKQGILGTISDKNGDKSLPNDGWQQDGQPQLIFSNPDLYWSSDYHLPRFGQGAFRAAIEGVWSEISDGKAVIKTVIGKPHAHTYHYAERVLQSHRTSLLGAVDEARVPKLSRVFMIGDNPESDIRGANDFDSSHQTQWTSVLVETGVHVKGSTPKYAPKKTVSDVLEAVKWALKQCDYRYTDDDFALEA